MHFGNITFIAEDYDCKPRTFEWKGKRDGDDGSRYAAGCNIIYGCKEGYLLNGNDKGRCHMDGDWGQRPTCKKGNQIFLFFFSWSKMSLVGYTNKLT